MKGLYLNRILILIFILFYAMALSHANSTMEKCNEVLESKILASTGRNLRALSTVQKALFEPFPDEFVTDRGLFSEYMPVLNGRVLAALLTDLGFDQILQNQKWQGQLAARGWKVSRPVADGPVIVEFGEGTQYKINWQWAEGREGLLQKKLVLLPAAMAHSVLEKFQRFVQNNRRSDYDVSGEVEFPIFGFARDLEFVLNKGKRSSAINDLECEFLHWRWNLLEHYFQKRNIIKFMTAILNRISGESRIFEGQDLLIRLEDQFEQLLGKNKNWLVMTHGYAQMTVAVSVDALRRNELIVHFYKGEQDLNSYLGRMHYKQGQFLSTPRIEDRRKEYQNSDLYLLRRFLTLFAEEGVMEMNIADYIRGPWGDTVSVSM